MSLKTNTSIEFGQSLIEVLVSFGILAILLPALLTGFVASREGRPQKENRVAATALVRETYEALRSAREENWYKIASPGIFHPSTDGSSWNLESGPENLGIFTRSIVISDVYRDNTGTIVSAGGTLDPSTKYAEISVSWQTPIASEVFTSTYLTRYLGNTLWEQTTQEQFIQGTFDNTVSKNNAGGEIELEQLPSADWSTPNLAYSYNSPGNTNSLAIFVEGDFAYMGTSTLYIFDISDPYNTTLVGSYSPGGTIYAIVVSNNYAYLATGINSSEIVVVDISNKANPVQASSINLNRNNDLYSIGKFGNYIVAGRDATPAEPELLIFDSSNAPSLSLVGSYEVNNDVLDVYPQGNYVYLSTIEDSAELRIIDISNVNSPTSAGIFDTPSNSDGSGVYFDGNYAYITTSNNGSGAEFYIVDVSSPNNTSLVGSMNIGAYSDTVFVVGDLAFLGTDSVTKEFLVVDISDKSNPVELSSYDTGAGGINSLFVKEGCAFGATDDNSKEFIVLCADLGGSAYANNGQYTSQTFDAGGSVGFNYFDFISSLPTNTGVSVQIATNTDNSTWNYVGPDGTNNTLYSASGAIPLNSVEGRYFRFKTYLSSDGSNTPILYEARINYSP
ncbi:hypothetical protein H6802_03470 [Candidatus Nomurabacteria bacterium]|uniref:LVIVD repeat protein n=1 Tax=candidate division WWE3 bacterium TaxID=2053526 RepID=A0A955E1H4_UNCKA|nr:hypothetical protein [candidate division WWE3 bacterium]MCB9823988.1 hypothetical protein [Candidatus Nomurabacteria bacterium]MCB9827042.1 hypothetical protein [Candidatus Nomurabacteria bacterium]MCB9827928.1 hypothetical protein [Candidatus Nomurabacteria bacterium]HXK52875.1 hypothetical protein [bacterium]